MCWGDLLTQARCSPACMHARASRGASASSKLHIQPGPVPTKMDRKATTSTSEPLPSANPPTPVVTNDAAAAIAVGQAGEQVGGARSAHLIGVAVEHTWRQRGGAGGRRGRVR